MECWVTDNELEDPREAVHDSCKTGTDIRGRNIEEGTWKGIIGRRSVNATIDVRSYIAWLDKEWNNKGGNESGRNRKERSREEAELVRAYDGKRRALRIGRRTAEIENWSTMAAEERNI